MLPLTRPSMLLRYGLCSAITEAGTPAARMVSVYTYRGWQELLISTVQLTTQFTKTGHYLLPEICVVYNPRMILSRSKYTSQS